MFLFKKKKDEKAVIEKALFDTVQEVLEGMLKTEYKKPGDGNEVDYELTCRVIKSQVRLALDFISNVKSDKKGVR